MDAIPIIRFVFALFLGGLVIYIGIPIINIFEGIFPNQGSYFFVLHGIWSFFPIIIIFREAIYFFRSIGGEPTT